MTKDHTMPPVFVDRDESLRLIVETVVDRALEFPEDIGAFERKAIEADATRRGITFTAAHALRRATARATIARIAATRAAVDIADAAIAAGHGEDALIYRPVDRRASVVA